MHLLARHNRFLSEASSLARYISDISNISLHPLVSPVPAALATMEANLEVSHLGAKKVPSLQQASKLIDLPYDGTADCAIAAVLAIHYPL